MYDYHEARDNPSIIPKLETVRKAKREIRYVFETAFARPVSRHLALIRDREPHLNKIKSRLKHADCLKITATLRHRKKEEIIRYLSQNRKTNCRFLASWVVNRNSFLRQNITYQLHQKLYPGTLKL